MFIASAPEALPLKEIEFLIKGIHKSTNTNHPNSTTVYTGNFGKALFLKFPVRHKAYNFGYMQK